MYTLTSPDGGQTREFTSKKQRDFFVSRGWTEGSEVPNVSDNKPVWVDYAVSQGMERGDAETMTKDDLMAEYR